jgi:hypothetical protein
MPFYRGKWRRGKANHQGGAFSQNDVCVDPRYVGLNLLGGISLEQAKKLADSLNENVLDASVKLSSQHPMLVPS